MITVSIKSDLILKHKATIFNWIVNEKKRKLDNLFSWYRNTKVKCGFFKTKFLETDGDIKEYFITQLSRMDDDQLVYSRILDDYSSLMNKYNMIIDMAKLSNHVVFSDEDYIFIELLRKCELGEL